MLFGPRAVPSTIYDAATTLRPLRIVNSYGLFAVMTTKRLEIVIEGSLDGEQWSEYEFRFKPGAVKRAPQYAAPHQPRLDWQMWFAALSPARNNPWFLRFCEELLKGNPRVLSLMEGDPFVEGKPQFVRALLYEYTFSDLEQGRESGNWWRRKVVARYLPPFSLSSAPARISSRSAG